MLACWLLWPWRVFLSWNSERTEGSIRYSGFARTAKVSTLSVVTPKTFDGDESLAESARTGFLIGTAAGPAEGPGVMLTLTGRPKYGTPL